MNKYYQMLSYIMAKGRTQHNKKGSIKYLTNEVLRLSPADLLDIFETHGIARKKLKTELNMFQAGITSTEQYRAEGISWWDYCGEQLKNSYPTYLEKLPALVERINKEKRNSKNYVLFLGETEADTNQAPCLSLPCFLFPTNICLLCTWPPFLHLWQGLQFQVLCCKQRLLHQSRCI